MQTYRKISQKRVGVILAGKWFRMAIGTVLMVLLLAGGWADAADTGMVSITVRASSDIRGADVRLGGIADIYSSDPVLNQKLHDLVIATAPLPGQSRTIDDQYIRLRLQQSNINLAQIKLDMPPTISITRKSIEIDRAMIERIVTDYLNKKLTWEKDRTKIKIVNVSDSLTLPDKPYTYKVVQPSNQTGLIGMIPLSIIFDVEGEPSRKVWATVKISVSTDVVVVQNPIARNQMISANDLEATHMDMAEVPTGYITQIQDAIGKRAMRPINPGEILRTDIIERPPIVKYNDMVSIVAETGCLRITTLGKAEENGRSGDRIKVMNVDSKKEIYARIVDSKTVRVDF